MNRNETKHRILERVWGFHLKDIKFADKPERDFGIMSIAVFGRDKNDVLGEIVYVPTLNKISYRKKRNVIMWKVIEHYAKKLFSRKLENGEI